MFFNKLKWALLWALLIFVLCVIPGKNIPHISFLDFHFSDKLIHLSLFYIQAVLTIQGLSGQNHFKIPLDKAILLAFFYCSLYGGLIEIIQELWCIDRSADIFDFFADVVGILLAILTYTKTKTLFWSNQ
jgi:VanZ family protein